jgi:hypothetical protein
MRARRASGTARDRRGVIVFLEFAATLPIFVILMLAAMDFHKYHKNQRHAYASARLGVDVRLDEHHSGRRTVQQFQLYPGGASGLDGRIRRIDGLDGLAPEIDHLRINEVESRAVRFSHARPMLGHGEAVGYHRSTRDAWTHFDITAQVNRDSPGGVTMGQGVESMPFIFYSPGKSQLVKEFLRL